MVHINSDLYMSIMNPMTFSMIVRLEDHSGPGAQETKNTNTISYSPDDPPPLKLRAQTHLISKTLCNPPKLPLTPLTTPSFTLSATTLVIPPSSMNFTPCSTPRQVDMS